MMMMMDGAEKVAANEGKEVQECERHACIKEEKEAEV